MRLGARFHFVVLAIAALLWFPIAVCGSTLSTSPAHPCCQNKCASVGHCVQPPLMMQANTDQVGEPDWTQAAFLVAALPFALERPAPLRRLGVPIERYVRFHQLLR